MIRNVVSVLIASLILAGTACFGQSGTTVGGGEKRTPPTHRTLALSNLDPTPHLQEAVRDAKAGLFWPKYDTIPPDIRQDAFFKDDLLKWEFAPAWKAEFYDCADEVFCLSMDQAVRGKKNAKIEMKVTGPDAKVVLTPPAPIRIDRDFDVIDFWMYGKYHYDTLVTITFRLKDGSLYTWSGGKDPVSGPGMLFSDWTLGHVALPKVLQGGAELLSIQLTPPSPGEYLYHIDQLRALSYRQYLAGKPAPKYQNVGPMVKLPVDPSGACPKTVEPVKTSVALKDGVGLLKYTTNSGEEVTYTYTPATGTLSDLVVDVKGKSPFKPADGSGPMFNYDGRYYSTGAYKAEYISDVVDGDALVYRWRYTTPDDSDEISYRFSLKGKTLQVQVNSGKGSVSSWLFGKGTGLKNQRVLFIPFMIYSPNMLINDGMFVSYYADWYKSNVSQFPRFGGSSVTGDTAQYSYYDPEYVYLPRTDGKRYPLKECLYITVSSTFDDCMFSISNPPSPYKKELSQRLFRMVSPTKNWVKMVRDTLNMYDRYGMTNLFMFFHAGLWSNKGGRGPEPWHSRMTTTMATPGGDKAIIRLFRDMKAMGINPGYYGGFNFYEPVSGIWDYDNLALNPDLSWQPGWVQCYHMKPWYFPELSSTFAAKQAAKFGINSIYEDGWTCGTPWDQNDYDHRIPGSGRMIDTINAMAAGFRNLRKTVGGPVFSEGNGRNFYTAGLDDGDYGKLREYASGKTPEDRRIELLVDFQLKKVHPLSTVVGLDIAHMLYGGDEKSVKEYKYWYQYLASEIAFGALAEMEPYSTLDPDPKKDFDRYMTCYFMLQQIQKRYIMEKVADVSYFDGQKLISTSQAILNGKYMDNMVRIRYANGLTIYVNCNWDGRNWQVSEGGKVFDLPPGGWYASQGKGFVEYSAMVDGRRVDFVDSPAYTFINPHGKPITLSGLKAEKITIRHKTGKHKGKVLTFPM